MGSMPRSSIADRVKGAVIGVCVCDALGGPVQFQKRGTFKPVTDYRYIANFDQSPGAWSDDGSMTLCLAQSLVDRAGKFSKADTAEKFTRWLRDGYYSSAKHAWDVGSGTSTALRVWQGAFKEMSTGSEVDVAKTQDEVERKAKFEHFSGNGSLMRVAPVGAALFRNVKAATKIAREQSDITHPYPVCGEACAVYTTLLTNIMAGEADKVALAKTFATVKIVDTNLEKRLAPYKTIEQWNVKPEAEISSSGWVVDSLEAALWGFFTTTSFEQGALKVVNLGDDSDSVGAVYGGLAGAYYGVGAIPKKWRDGLVKADLVTGVAEKLAEVVGNLNA